MVRARVFANRLGWGPVLICLVVIGCAQKAPIQKLPFTGKPETAPPATRSYADLVRICPSSADKVDVSEEWKAIADSAPAWAAGVYDTERPLPCSAWYEYLRSGQDFMGSADQTLLKAYGTFDKEAEKQDASCALRHLAAGTLALDLGMPRQARDHFQEAVRWMEELTDKELEQKAAMGRSDVKIYKGDSHERTMVHFYLGLIAYQLGEYKEAQRGFRKALMAHQTRPNAGTQGRFAAIHYWLGKSYVRLGDMGNARVAMRKAQSCEAGPESNALFNLQRLQEDNLIIVIQIGAGAGLIPQGGDWQQTAYKPTPYAERAAEVFIDGQHVGSAVMIADLWEQVSTQGQTEEQRIQASKAAAKSIVQSLPYISLLGVAWDVTGDMRSWALLPDRILVWSGKVPSGDHTVILRFYDDKDFELTRYRQTWYFVPVPAEGDCVVVTRAARDKCNICRKEQ